MPRQSCRDCPVYLLLLNAALIVLFGGCDALTSHPPIESDIPEDLQPAWSSNGKHIAYFHWEKREDTPPDSTYPTGLYVLDLATGTRRLVVKGFALSPDWSPDGERLVFSAGDIAMIRPDGSDRRWLTDHGSAFSPAWNPDGFRVAYDATENKPSVPPDSSGIWLMRSDGTRRNHLGLGRNADWSPAGNLLVYEGPPGTAEGYGQIWVADTSDSQPKQLTSNGFMGNRDPAWSPDGRWIAWTALYEGGTHALWLMRMDGSEQHELLSEGREPTWSPDSQWLVFVAPSPKGDRLVLWKIRRDGSGLTQITF